VSLSPRGLVALTGASQVCVGPNAWERAGVSLQEPGHDVRLGVVYVMCLR